MLVNKKDKNGREKKESGTCGRVSSLVIQWVTESGTI